MVAFGHGRGTGSRGAGRPVAPANDKASVGVVLAVELSGRGPQGRTRGSAAKSRRSDLHLGTSAEPLGPPCLAVGVEMRVIILNRQVDGSGNRTSIPRVVLHVGPGRLIYLDQRKLRAMWLADSDDRIAGVIGPQGPDTLDLTGTRLADRLKGHRGAQAAAHEPARPGWSRQHALRRGALASADPPRASIRRAGRR